MPIFTETETYGRQKISRKGVKEETVLHFDQGTFSTDDKVSTVTAPGTAIVLSPFELAVTFTDPDTKRKHARVYAEEEITALNLGRVIPARTVEIFRKERTIRRARTERIKHDLVLLEPPIQRAFQ
ncbi:MAG: hypothetical protein ACREHC_01510 [Candidatus Levyibacteriota bacterium]